MAAGRQPALRSLPWFVHGMYIGPQESKTDSSKKSEMDRVGEVGTIRKRDGSD